MDNIARHTEDVLKLFDEKALVKICAPMVRYSKLQFRTVVRQYGCDLCYTPMILADSFCKSEKARNNEFTTSVDDTTLITQFAANTVQDFVGAAHIVSPYCSGADLNCGCPQRWAKQMGLGCALLERPELIADLVKTCRNQIAKPFTISVKTRILKDLKKTVEICKQLEAAGVSFLTIHSRTPSESTGEVNLEALKLINENVQCPLVANGGVKTLDDCYRLQDKTKCKGIMVANGLLTNPTLFSGSNKTTVECIQKWLDTCYNSTLSLEDYLAYGKLETSRFDIPEKPNNLTFQCFHHHLVFMLEKVLPKKKRRLFNNFQTFAQVLEFLREEFGIEPKLFSQETFLANSALKLDYNDRSNVYNDLLQIFCGDRFKDLNKYDYDSTDGNYFKNKVNKSDVDTIDDSFNNLFLED